MYLLFLFAADAALTKLLFRGKSRAAIAVPYLVRKTPHLFRNSVEAPSRVYTLYITEHTLIYYILTYNTHTAMWSINIDATDAQP